MSKYPDPHANGLMPVQSSNATKVDERLARRAYRQYAAQYGEAQSFEGIHKRGGFSWSEIAYLLYREIVDLEEKLNSVQPNGKGLEGEQQ